MRKYLFIAPLLFVAACANTVPRTASQGVYDVTVAFVAAVKTANAYAGMPRCSATVKLPCSDQNAVDRIVSLANSAGAQVENAQKVAKDTSVGTDVEKASAAARGAVNALVQAIPATTQGG